MTVTIIFAVLLLVIAVSLIALAVNEGVAAVCRLRRSDTSRVVKRLKKNAVVFAAAFAVCAGVCAITQIAAYTPAIQGENAISELRRVTLNGRKEWISIRGDDVNNPVLLFLAGGTGGSQMAAVRHDLSELEKHFVVVNWDQPGSGKSYGAIKTADITVDTYIEDGYALTRYLCETFNKEKIFIVGESWGSALGIFLIDKAPELYHAFIGTGQMVAFVETEVTDYNTALAIAHKNGDSDKIAKLEANGSPPYYGSDVTWKSAEYLNYLGDIMARNPDIHNGGYNTFRDLFSPEYGIIDKINYLRGIVNTFNHVYPQLYETDLRVDYTKLGVPVYFFLGRHDINAPTALAEEYFTILDTPKKGIVWFEHSGHSPWINESGKFVEEILEIAEDCR